MGLFTKSSTNVSTQEIYDSYNRTLNSADTTTLSGVGNISIGIGQTPAEIGSGLSIVETIKNLNPVFLALIIGAIVFFLVSRKG